MPRCSDGEVVISGIGVTSAIGQGKAAFLRALMAGQHAFSIMRRPGRQKGSSFLGAELPPLCLPTQVSDRTMRTASLPAQAAIVTLHEAWKDASLDSVEPTRIGLIVGGSNFQQRGLVQIYESYADRPHFLRPSYGLSFMDTDICGICTEQFGIKGLAYTVGGASASGQLAIINAIQAIATGAVEVCIALGALMDLSHWECQALRSLGAMGSDRYSDEPSAACRPFDQSRDGFIYGEACGAVVIEKATEIRRQKIKPYAVISGWGVAMDAARTPEPSLEGEAAAIKKALDQADLQPADIDYINAHGTGSIIGDEVELKALTACRLSHAHINATKSITGHGLTAAGTVEVIATLLQMESNLLHPTRNLRDPIDASFRWVRDEAQPHVIENALTLSMGFGGTNTALSLTRF